MNLLDDIKSPNDIRDMSVSELDLLAKEIRHFLVKGVSRTGGHLSSNLGVVELTLALHYAFDTPMDKIIWDVGHQAYIHKIITGRKDKFDTLRKMDGLSGFPKSGESEYDVFDTGHSSTSISAGLGYAQSRDLLGEKYNVISVIGDGSMSGGLAFEALNNAGRSESNLIIILNDNEMSISENVGAVSKHLNKIRTAPTYLGAKRDVEGFLNKVPIIGKGVSKFVEKAKDSIKYFFISGVIFEELGFKYIGLVDGHNISEMVSVMEKVKNMNGPILIHVLTKKGKGYPPAEKSPERFHGIAPFHMQTGKLVSKQDISYTNIFSHVICKNAAMNKRIVAVTASMPSGTGLSQFHALFPERFFDVGIAEGHAVTFSAALAKNGLVPVVSIYSSFLQRAYDNILHDVCLQNLHVVFAIDRAGIVGSDGETHQGVFDISFLSHMPNMTILAPSSSEELPKMLEYALACKGPVAMRYPRQRVFEYKSHEEIISGKSEFIKYDQTKQDIAILSIGTMLETAIEVGDDLKNHSPSIINARFIKPIDMDMLRKIKDFKHIFILEDNVRTGGYGATVIQTLSEFDYTAKIHLLSFPDEFIKQGTREEIFKKYGLDTKGILAYIRKVINA